jgi:hypothetical protein
MATYTKTILSGSTDGRGIKVAASATPGTTVHTGSSSSSTFQEVWIWASNPGTTSYTLTLEFGGSSSPDDLIVTDIPADEGLVLVSPGLVLRGNATPLVIKAFASTTNQVTLFGYVNQVA